MNERRANYLGLLAKYRARCEASGKTCYATRKKALRENGKRSRSANAYLCELCGCWHITTRRSDR